MIFTFYEEINYKYLELYLSSVLTYFYESCFERLVIKVTISKHDLLLLISEDMHEEFDNWKDYSKEIINNIGNSDWCKFNLGEVIPILEDNDFMIIEFIYDKNNIAGC